MQLGIVNSTFDCHAPPTDVHVRLQQQIQRNPQVHPCCCQSVQRFCRNSNLVWDNFRRSIETLHRKHVLKKQSNKIGMIAARHRLISYHIEKHLWHLYWYAFIIVSPFFSSGNAINFLKRMKTKKISCIQGSVLLYNHYIIGYKFLQLYFRS